MGGLGSGRCGGRPTADMSKRIDIAWMVRTERAIPGALVTGACTGASAAAQPGRSATRRT